MEQKSHHSDSLSASGSDPGGGLLHGIPEWLHAAFRAEELGGHRLATRVRLISLVAIGALVVYLTSAPSVYAYVLILALFALIGIANYLADKHFGRLWLKFFFVALDFVLLTVTFVLVTPWLQESWPEQMVMRNGQVIYYFLMVAVIAFSYSGRLMLWAGTMAAVSWTGGYLWLLARPDTITKFDHPAAMTPATHLADHLDARFIDIDVWLQGLVVLLLVAAALAAVAARSRRLVVGQAQAARQRGNLARYFSPNLVDTLAGRDRAFAAIQRRDVAVLFADMVGFTALAESLPPEKVMALLRAFHTRMEDQVFRHDGTLEKYIGDALLATFGAPSKGERDAAQAVSCMHAMLASLAVWNDERTANGESSVRVGIGVHYGPAVFGDIGSERNMAFAVIGDTVNTASRLQGLTRSLNCAAVVSGDAVRAARAQAGDDADTLLAGLNEAEPQPLRGRRQAVDVWTLGGQM